jgi:hypothetical protein
MFIITYIEEKKMILVRICKSVLALLGIIISATTMAPTFALSSDKVDGIGQTVGNATSNQTILVDGTNYTVTYNISNGKISDLKLDTNSKSLITSIQTSGDGGLTITLPRSLIDVKKSDGSDDQFIVLNDGQVSQFTESDFASDRTLNIPFINGTEQIEIIGTQAVPEFGPIMIIVFAIGIMLMVTLSLKTRLRFIDQS